MHLILLFLPAARMVWLAKWESLPITVQRALDSQVCLNQKEPKEVRIQQLSFHLENKHMQENEVLFKKC